MRALEAALPIPYVSLASRASSSTPRAKSSSASPQIAYCAPNRSFKASKPSLNPHLPNPRTAAGAASITWVSSPKGRVRRRLSSSRRRRLISSLRRPSPDQAHGSPHDHHSLRRPLHHSGSPGRKALCGHRLPALVALHLLGTRLRILTTSIHKHEMGQLVCGSCRELIAYPRGAVHVQCAACRTINLVLEVFRDLRIPNLLQLC